jgi:Tfp pilus assembly protein PilO
MRLRSDRIWLIGGVAAAALLLTIGWLFVIGPQRTQASSLHDQEAAAQLDHSSLTHKLELLEEQNGNLSQYQAQLSRDRKALPTTAALADFLRELQAAGDSVGVAVTGLIVGAPTEADAAGVKVLALPITLTLTGTSSRLGQFLDQLQRLQPRAVLITSAHAIPDQHSTTLAGSVALNLSVQAFVAGVDN